MTNTNFLKATFFSVSLCPAYTNPTATNLKKNYACPQGKQGTGSELEQD